MLDSLKIDLNDLYLFAEVVERHSFTAAADALNMPKSRISRRVAQLEAKLGSRLLQRTSRRMSLTDAGLELYSHCVAMIAEARAGVDAVRNRLDEPTGAIRVSLPVTIAEIVLADLMLRFMRQYPKVHLRVQATNRMVDLINENIDVVVRGVGLVQESSSLVRTSLCNVRWGLVVSPIYLEKVGVIDTLEVLAATDALFYAPINEYDVEWNLFGHNDSRIKLPIKSLKLQSDNLTTLKEATLAGMGVCGLPLYICAAEIAAGTLKVIFPELRTRAGHLVMLFPTRRGLAPAVRAFVDFLKAELPCLLEFR